LAFSFFLFGSPFLSLCPYLSLTYFRTHMIQASSKKCLTTDND
jgi:hypothetical protein